MAEIVILGAGFGGLATAHALRPALTQGHTVTLIDRSSRLLMGLSKLCVLVDERSPEAGCGDRTRLNASGIRVIEAEVTHVDRAARRVRTSAGDHPYDYLIVAMGAETAPDAIPGLPVPSNLYDRAQVPGLRDQLKTITKGTVAIVVCGTPYKCPPAPFEAAMLVDSFLRARGVRDSVALEVVIPDPNPMPVAGPSAGQQARALLQERGITLRANAKLTRVDSAAGELFFAQGERLRYDILLAIPPHRAPLCVKEAGLTDASGWIPVDPETLATSDPQVWAVGDVTAIRLPGSGMLPKAGIMAELQGEVVGQNLLGTLEGGGTKRTFDGSGYCFFEVGGHRAMMLHGAFYSEPGNRVRFEAPSTEAYAMKERFESERLARWFG